MSAPAGEASGSPGEKRFSTVSSVSFLNHRGVQGRPRSARRDRATQKGKAAVNLISTATNKPQRAMIDLQSQNLSTLSTKRSVIVTGILEPRVKHEKAGEEECVCFVCVSIFI